MRHPLELQIAKLFSMKDDVWEKHANPWSVWTRFTALPLLILAIWSRIWIGAWSWTAVAVAIFWIWVNPRLFAKPKSTNNWASKAVLGERVWINRVEISVPSHHSRAPNILNGVSAMGLLPLIWGLWSLDHWPVLLGAILVYAGKLWFLDRMVWLYSEMKDAAPEYSNWLY